MDIQASSIFVSSLSDHNEVEMVGQFGISPEIWQVYPEGTSVFEKFPITDAMRNRKDFHLPGDRKVCNTSCGGWNICVTCD